MTSNAVARWQRLEALVDRVMKRSDTWQRRAIEAGWRPEEPAPVPRTLEERLEFERAWDSRVEAGWARNGRPAPETHRGQYPPSIIGTRRPRERGDT